MKNTYVVREAIKNSIVSKQHELWREIDKLYEVENGKRNLLLAMALNQDIYDLKQSLKKLRTKEWS